MPVPKKEKKDTTKGEAVADIASYVGINTDSNIDLRSSRRTS